MYIYFSFIYSATLCLLIGASNPFKVIINKNVLIAIWLTITLDFYTNVTIMVTLNNIALSFYGDLTKGIAIEIPALILSKNIFEVSSLYFVHWMKQ